jgi:hypothetical protein
MVGRYFKETKVKTYHPSANSKTPGPEQHERGDCSAGVDVSEIASCLCLEFGGSTLTVSRVKLVGPTGVKFGTHRSQNPDPLELGLREGGDGGSLLTLETSMIIPPVHVPLYMHDASAFITQIPVVFGEPVADRDGTRFAYGFKAEKRGFPVCQQISSRQVTRATFGFSESERVPSFPFLSPRKLPCCLAP